LTEASQPADLPSRIGKYEIVSRVGRGAMGVVYHARDPFLERDVALKVMLPQIAGDPDQKGRFEREARAVAKIVHPNVLTVFDLGYHHDGSPYIAMELLKGQDLLHVLRGDWSLALERKVDIIVQLLDGLACAHQAGIVHRDVKPANIFLTVDGTVKIMDFGVARFTMSSTTGTGAVMGTADYMSPEQVQGAKVDGRTDLWSAGCVLYQLLTGHRPFTGESIMTVFYKITHTAPVLELPASPEFQALVPIVMRSLARNADERYQNAAEFAAELRAFRKAYALPVPQVAAPPPSAAAAAKAAKPADDLLEALVGEAKAASGPTDHRAAQAEPKPAPAASPAAAPPPAADAAPPLPPVPAAPPPGPHAALPDDARRLRDRKIGPPALHPRQGAAQPLLRARADPLRQQRRGRRASRQHARPLRAFEPGGSGARHARRPARPASGWARSCRSSASWTRSAWTRRWPCTCATCSSPCWTAARARSASRRWRATRTLASWPRSGPGR
jgi:hypothetical protein